MTMNAIDMTATDRSDLAGFLGDIERLESIFDTWDATSRAAVEAYRHAIDAINAEALRRLVRALKADPAALAAMKDAVGDEIVYAVLRHHDIVKASLSERVEVALAGVRPMLASHGGDVELVKVAPPSIDVRFLGACDGCAASALTFHAGVKKAVQDACPEITEIMQVKGHGGGGARFISPFVLDTKGNWLFVGALSDIPDGGVLAVGVGGESIIVSRHGAIVTCFRNACAHLGLPIDDGEVVDTIITCAHHGFQYDLGTGECLTAPDLRLQPHAVRVTARGVEVRLAK
jgi:Fe-S cluster biogenesis protein NfuA/nitrite reductase/ring-hydroxylating ferredoxin subunit